MAEPVRSGSTAVLLGGAPEPVVAPPGGELLQRSTFGDGRALPWMPLFIAPATGEAGVRDGAYCLRVDRPGKNRWDVQLRHREMTIEKGHTYAVRYTAWATAPVTLRAKVGMAGPPYTEYWSQSAVLSPTRQDFSDRFEVWVNDDPTAELAFHLSDAAAKYPVTICLDAVHLTDPEYRPPPRSAAVELPAVRVNQLGYLPGRAKRATWVLSGSDAEARAQAPAPFELVRRDGEIVARGTTEPFGRDPTSGTFVQRIDFSTYRGSGDGFRLRVLTPDGAQAAGTSDEFSIQPGLYTRLSRDALRYFYLTRSGIPLEQPYVENSVWARPAGHPTDAHVACAPDAGCSTTLDVSGGWYDAGDYGKYVVNGGLSVWLLLNLWEVSQRLGLPSVGTRDRDLNLPESGNGVPDLLDEARWELEWMMRMQVPEGLPQAGLVHHKVHDSDWTSLGTLPELDPAVPRWLRPVSTAATLNLAAVAAQAARVYAPFDPAFAARCLTAARRAWAAAEANPKLVITLADNHGGGAYEDANLTDERFWAAAELSVTTHEPSFRDVVTHSPHYLAPRARAEGGLPQAMDWRNTDALGTISLSFDAKPATVEERERSRRALVAVAEEYLALSRADAFAQPYSGTHYPWGSNSFLLNNGIVLALAHAFTGEPRFLDGATASLDYVLGRNALGKSYVSGYGARPLTHPHHRFWAQGANPKFPPVPPGLVAGGPNTDLQDPYSRGGNAGCVGQTCYFDHVEAYSANEVAINWNAELAWLVAYVNGTPAKPAGSAAPPPARSGTAAPREAPAPVPTRGAP